jgi:uncharacterized protein (TIGR00304 family)
VHLRTLAPVGLFVAGVACIAASVVSGETDVSLLVIFPVFTGSSGLFLLGTALVVFSFIAGFMALMVGQVELAGAVLNPGDGTPEATKTRTDKRYGGVVLIGPVPIAFGSDRRTALAMLAVGIVLAIAVLVALAILLG